MADDYGFGVEVAETGFDDLMKRLDKLGVELGRPAEERMVRAGAEIGKEEMVRLAPVLAEKSPGSDALDPGAIRDGIRILMPKNADPVEARVGPRGRKLVRIATDVEYGHREVHGGRLELLGNGKVKGRGVAGKDVPAHPFVRPAYENTQGESEKAMIAELDKVITEAMG